MYAFVRESGHTIWKKRWYAFTSKISLQADIYMTQEDQVFVVDVVITNPMRETMVSNVICQPTNATTKLNTIVKIHKYRGFHERCHFIMMVMEVHGTLGHDIDYVIKECAHLFHDR